MASVLVPAEASQESVAPVVLPRRKRFTRSDVNRLNEAGIFEGQRYELIEGDLIDKMGQNPPHAWSVAFVHSWLAKIFGGALIRGQLPVEVAREDRDHSEPEPDLVVVVERKLDYATRHPRGDELLLLIEVADTSVYFDRRVKVALYARASVPEYWVLDVSARALFVHRHPLGGGYKQVTRLAEDETVAPDSRPDASVKVSELLPPVAAA
jgi:Uma2 family endonuclease